MKASLMHNRGSAAARQGALASSVAPSDHNTVNALAIAGTAAWRSAAIFAVKLIHSLIFLSIAASILHIFYAGITNRSSRMTRISLALALSECLVFVAYGWRCPLRTLAEELGAESGQVTDIFLPRWLADRIPWIFTPPLVTGILALLWHRLCSPGHTPPQPGSQRV